MSNQTLIVLAWELHEQGVPHTHIAQRLNRHRETIILWIQAIKEYGLTSFLERYGQAKKGHRIHRQVDPILKRWIWQIREREMDCCGQKIKYWLDKEHGVSVSVPKIYEILKEKYIVKSKWKKNKARGPVPTATTPRLGWAHYQPQEIPALTDHLEQFLWRYHYQRPHIGLGMRPPLSIT